MEKQHDHDTDEPCKYHKSMCDSLVKFAAHIKDLREENAVMSKTLHEVAATVRAINETLIGTLEKQGMIGRVDKQLDDLRREVAAQNVRIDDLEELKKNIIGKIILAAALCFAAIVGAAFVIVKISLGV